MHILGSDYSRGKVYEILHKHMDLFFPTDSDVTWKMGTFDRATVLAFIIDRRGFLKGRCPGQHEYLQSGDDYDHLPDVIFKQREALTRALAEDDESAFSGSTCFELHPSCKLQQASQETCSCKRAYDAECQGECHHDPKDISSGYNFEDAHIMTVDHIKTYCSCVANRLEIAMEAVERKLARMDSMESAVQILQPLFPIVAEMLLMQCVHFAVEKSHGACVLCTDHNLSNGEGTCFRVLQEVVVCHAAAGKGTGRKTSRIQVSLRVRADGLGVECKWRMTEDITFLCLCAECKASMGQEELLRLHIQQMLSNTFPLLNKVYTRDELRQKMYQHLGVLFEGRIRDVMDVLGPQDDSGEGEWRVRVLVGIILNPKFLKAKLSGDGEGWQHLTAMVMKHREFLQKRGMQEASNLDGATFNVELHKQCRLLDESSWGHCVCSRIFSGNHTQEDEQDKKDGYCFPEAHWLTR